METKIMAKDKKVTMDFLKDFNKEIEKMEGVSTTAEPPRYWFGFGNHAINRVMSGSFYKGVPQGRITALCGPSSAGKSFLAGNLCKQAQKEGAFVLVVDSENALDDTFMSNIGVDVNNDYSYTSPNTISQTLKIVSSFIKGYKSEYGDSLDAPKILIVVDSLDMLMTDTEKAAADKGDTQADQGQHSKQLKALLRTWVQDIKSLNISIVVTKQVYRAKQDQLLQGEGAWVINDAIRYACSQILLATRLKLKDEKTKSVTGIRMTVQGFKTRFCSPFSVVSNLEIPYDTGVNPFSGIFDVAVTLGVILKHGAWYSIEGDNTNYRSADIERDHMERVVQLCEEKSQNHLDTTPMHEDMFVEDTGHKSVKSQSA
jgi:RecA/RadA recombinase